MKLFIRPVLAVLVALPTAHAQDFLQGLFDSQTEASSSSSSSSSGSGGTPVQNTQPDVTPVTSTSSSVNCPSTGQKTIPLKYVLGMMRTKGASLQVSHDLAAGKLNVAGGEFLSNCNGMLEWGLRRPSADFPQYVVELKIKACGAETCQYNVMEKNDAGEVVEKQITAKPDFAGFQQCLKDTGVISATGAVDSKKMVIRDLDINLPGVESSAPVWFGSNLPVASAAYKKQKEIGCYYMEDIRQGGYAVYTAEDAERMSLDDQANRLCQSDNYRQISEFLERYGQYSTLLGSIRDELIKKTYKDMAEVIKKGENLETQDYSILADFQRYIIDPLTTRIATLYERIGGMPQGQERRLKEKELQDLMKELASYKAAPYITQQHIDKLMAKGLFDEATVAHGIHLTAQNYGRLGANESGTLVTPRVARQRIEAGKQAFKQQLVSRREQHDVQTGRLTGRSEYYGGLAAQHRRNITIRTNNYQTEINNEMARISQGGYCYRYFRNTQRCIQDSMQRIQDLRNQLLQYNQSDANIAADLEQKANQYRAWESEGQRYIAAQNGDAPTEEQPETSANPDVPVGPSVTAPQADRQDEQQGQGQQPMYTFNMPQGQGQQGYNGQMPTQYQGAMPGMQYNPYMQQQQYSGQFQQNMIGSPWGSTQQQQYYNPYMQQQSPYMGYGMQNGGQGYTFNMSGAMGMQQPYMNYGMQGYGGNMWAGQQNPYQMNTGMGMQYGAGMGMQSPMMYNSPFSQGMQGLSYYR